MKVAIAGYGIEGKANLEYWRRLGNEMVVLDEKEAIDIPDGVFAVSGEDAFTNLSSYDLVVRTASLQPNKLASARKIWSATNEFFSQCPAPIIGVTGTKGKGTTASIIASILRATGKTVHLVGNIGVPALTVLPNIQSVDVVVFEMSSFQLWDIEKSPHIAVVLMIEPDHLDTHYSMDDYLTAKSHIAMSQTATDTTVYHPHNVLSQRVAMNGEGQKIRYMIADDAGVYEEGNNFCVQGKQICSLDILQIPGRHNVENACAAITASLAYDRTLSPAFIEAGLKDFTGLPHRLKYIREIDGVQYFDDNYSSAPGAAVAAMRAFSQPEVFIMGGYDKKIDFAELALAISAQSNIKRIVLIGQTRHAIATALDAVGKQDIYELSDEINLPPIVERAKELAVRGDVVVMSPACASFDMFKNFSDRGDQFIATVEAL